MSSDVNDELVGFTSDLIKFLANQNSTDDALCIAAALMKTAIEIYTITLEDEEIHSILDVVAESIPTIRENSLPKLMDVDYDNTTIH